MYENYIKTPKDKSLKQVDKQPLPKMKPSRWVNICLEENSRVG